MSKWIPSVLVCLVLCTPAYSQTLGTITGEVKDESGATVPGATVTAQNVATNAVRTQVSNVTGNYTFPAMPPGMYQVKAELQGFKTVQNAVELHVEETLRVDFTLAVGALTETTEVSATSTLISTSNATVGTVIENRRIVELPLNGRNYLSLIALSPNVSAGFAGRRPGRRSPGRLACQPADLHLGPAARVQLLHARRRGQHRRQFQHLHLPAVGGRARGIQGADRHLFGRVRPRRRPGERRHQVGLECLPWHGLRVPPQRQVRRASVRVHGRAGRRRRRRRSSGISSATRPRARC